MKTFLILIIFNWISELLLTLLLLSLMVYFTKIQSIVMLFTVRKLLSWVRHHILHCVWIAYSTNQKDHRSKHLRSLFPVCFVEKVKFSCHLCFEICQIVHFFQTQKFYGNNNFALFWRVSMIGSSVLLLSMLLWINPLRK